ncbi:outer membrane lipoprotein-sorting protein [Desulfolithobacter dissulfuricans]|nr:outer membrane lipoprotein-sorting protein [Desulfolithobacter dissulfuricans]
MKNTVLYLMIGCLLAALPGQALAVDGNALLRQVDANLQPESYEMYRKLINIEPDGRKKEFVFYTAKKGKDRMVALFLSPASEKGRVSLRIGDNMWLYIPNVGKPIRITSLQSVVGGVFNNSDILRLDFHVEYDVAAVIDQGDTWSLELQAKTRAVAYDRLKMTVDKKTVQPLDIQCFASSGMLIKTLHYSDIKDLGDGVVRPAKLITDSPLHKGYRSVMIFAKIKKREFDDEVFSLEFMPRVDELR